MNEDEIKKELGTRLWHYISDDALLEEVINDINKLIKLVIKSRYNPIKSICVCCFRVFKDMSQDRYDKNGNFCDKCSVFISDVKKKDEFKEWVNNGRYFYELNKNE